MKITVKKKNLVSVALDSSGATESITPQDILRSIDTKKLIKNLKKIKIHNGKF